MDLEVTPDSLAAARAFMLRVLPDGSIAPRARAGVSDSAVHGQRRAGKRPPLSAGRQS
jgi:hypothetical protein